MQNNAGGIDDFFQRGFCLTAGIGHDTGAQGLHRGHLLNFTGEDIFPQILQNLPHRLCDSLRRHALAEGEQQGLLHQFIYLGDLTQKLLIHGSKSSYVSFHYLTPVS